MNIAHQPTECGPDSVERQASGRGRRPSSSFSGISRGPGPQPARGSAPSVSDAADERDGPPVEGRADEDAAERRRRRRIVSKDGPGDAQALLGLGVEHRGDQRLAPSLLGVRQIEAPLVDVAHEVRLIPERIAALDLRASSARPSSPPGSLQPLQRAGVPRIALGARAARRFGRSTSQTTTRMPRREHEGADGRDAGSAVPAERRPDR